MDLSDGAYAVRSERGKLQIRGPQAAWFLDQVLTQSFADMAVGEARDSAMITPHGRMTAYLEAVRVDEESFLCHFESSLRDSLPDDLRRYVFATRVEIVDVTDEMDLVAVVGGGPVDLPDDAIVQETRAFGVAARYVWLPRGGAADLVVRLKDAAFEEASEADLEAARVAAGVPRWGRDMGPKTIPQEAGIDEWAVHFDKGCYLGQEAMAKIHFRGKPNKRLRRVLADGDLRPGTDVQLDGERVGTVTSAAGPRALAMLRHTVPPGADVVVGEVNARVEA